MALQHEKDRAISNWENVPDAFSAGTVNHEWAYGVELVDGEGNVVENMTGMIGTGAVAVGADEANFEFNLPAAVEDGQTKIVMPEKLYLAVLGEDDKADMATAIQVF